MRRFPFLLAFLSLFFFIPNFILADEPGAGHDRPLHLHVVSIAPFALLLLGIALLPLLAPHFWHGNSRKLLVSLGLSLPVVVYLFFLDQGGQPALAKLEHSLVEYLDFMVFLGALYTVAGGIVLEGSFTPRPLVNTLFLGTGALLANVIGTTGASMLLIRPVLRINANRKYVYHIPVFFIFCVSNVGGLLTPLGDPPLFLGFLRGIDFFWTLSLWPQWALVNGLVLLVFFCWESLAFRREDIMDQTPGTVAPFRLRGLFNFVFLAGILLSVLLRSQTFADGLRAWCNQFFVCPDLHLTGFVPMGVTAAMALLSWLTTSRNLRRENHFTWEAILEVAVLFIGIFITMIPALQLLEVHRQDLGLTQPWQYFWYTGALSSFLDNAPTYLTFATIAAGTPRLGVLMDPAHAHILAAISCGAVFMGANTYIGNGPNFMVKAIAEESGFRTPSFFGYMLFSCLILLPIFALTTWIFFW